MKLNYNGDISIRFISNIYIKEEEHFLREFLLHLKKQDNIPQKIPSEIKNKIKNLLLKKVYTYNFND